MALIQVVGVPRYHENMPSASAQIGHVFEKRTESHLMGFGGVERGK